MVSPWIGRDTRGTTLRVAIVWCGAVYAASWLVWHLAARSTPPAFAEASGPGHSSIGLGARTMSLAASLDAHAPSPARDPFSSSLLADPTVKARASQTVVTPAAPDIVPDRSQVEADRTLTLGAIMVGSARAAMINGAVYAEGDPVSSFRLVRIEPDHVVLERGHTLVTLRIR